MYREEIYELIKTAPNFPVVKTYYFLANLKQFEGGVITNTKYIAECIKISTPAVNKAIEWLVENNYITESKLYGQKQYILNKIVKREEKNAEKVEEIAPSEKKVAEKVAESVPSKKKDGSHRQYLPE